MSRFRIALKVVLSMVWSCPLEHSFMTHWKKFGQNCSPRTQKMWLQQDKNLGRSPKMRFLAFFGYFCHISASGQKSTNIPMLILGYVLEKTYLKNIVEWHRCQLFPSPLNRRFKNVCFAPFKRFWLLKL